MLPVQYPRKRTALVTTFLVWPIVLVSRVSAYWSYCHETMEDCRHTSCVRNLHAQNEHKCGIVRPSQIVADEPTNMLICGHKAQTKGASQIWNQEDQNKHTASIFKPVIKIDTGQNGKGDENSVGDLNQLHVSGRKIHEEDIKYLQNSRNQG